MKTFIFFIIVVLVVIANILFHPFIQPKSILEQITPNSTTLIPTMMPMGEKITYANALVSIPSKLNTPVISLANPTVTPNENYSVVKGDTLISIGIKLGISAELLALTNDITDPNLIYVGQVLIIPDINSTPIVDNNKKQIVIKVTLQKLYAMENSQVIKKFSVSTGLLNTPTVLGKYSIYKKVISTSMRGEGYDLANVPWVMAFYNNYSIHGTYWHDNFGQPMSHGCVNMKTDEAKWLYEWAPVGTDVSIIK